MTAWRPARGRRVVRHRAGQRGATLLELLLAIAISGILIGPLSAWAWGTMRHQGTARDELGRASATGLLNSYFLRDVASARLVSVTSSSDCNPSTPTPRPSDGGQPKVVITPSGAVSSRVVYSEVDDGATSTLWRRVCAEDGSLQDATAVFRELVPGLARSWCGPTDPGPDCVAARKVSLRLQPSAAVGQPARPPVLISTVRRTDQGSVGLATSSPPVADIELAPSRGYRSTEFTVTSNSSDPDGEPLTLQWTRPMDSVLVSGSETGTGMVLRFPNGTAETSQTVTLRVTDASGASSVITASIRIFGRSPTAVAACSPVAGQDRTYTLSSSGTADPETAVANLGYSWTVGGTPVGDGATRTWVAPPDVSGAQQVTLVVENTDRLRSTAFAQCLVPTLNPASGVVISPAPVSTGPGLPPHINAARPGAPLLVTFSVDVPPPAGSQTGWNLYRRGSNTVANTVEDTESWPVPFSTADAGEWEIERITRLAGAPDTLPPAPRVAFRINAAPTAAITISETAGTVPRIVTFTSIASADADGSVVARQWDFGDGTPPSSDGTTVHTFTGAGTYAVVLTVIDDLGAASSTTETVTVEP